MNHRKATRSDWKREPISKFKTQLKVDKNLTLEEYNYLSWGIVPQEMEDKWFIYLEDNWLYYHRSWTGYCIFEVRLEKVDNGYKIAEAWVNDDPSQHFHNKSLPVWIDWLIKINREREYCSARVIIAFFIYIFLKDILEDKNKFYNTNFLVFTISFFSHFYPKTVFKRWDFSRDVYRFIHYYNIKIIFD
ncbi:MAG: hypothetical protein AAGA80_27695 [Cyanobacteria bacterium P01_F01_bin.143]